MRRSALAALALAAVLLTGCDDDELRACTHIGGLDGISLSIPSALYVDEGSVHFEVCDGGGCATAVRRLGHLPHDTQMSTGRGSQATFEQLGRTFDPGTVHVTVELRDGAGLVVARREQEVELTPHWPNGKDCDGDGFVSGGLDLRPEDAVVPPA